ncbi:hypothetical protein CANINC_003734 [Pichia inconspicua]|uniref:Zn(2)-C6 fungal-type domain-containing protein n=1 Tax=Pichia inconspicua TaxID=52247 RepID=A0A4T0WXR2_9ASCO|nr:hypothetical protein CANINC_003734 [[Candida] inconspicua]
MSPTNQSVSKKLANGKVKNTKSRNGCVTCKKRRLKCDETKPLCQNCTKRGIVCGGYVVNFKWRDFNSTNSIISSVPKYKNQGDLKKTDFLQTNQNQSNGKDSHLKRAMEDATKSVTGRSSEEIALANVLIANGKHPDVAALIASTIANLSDTESTKQFLFNNHLNDLAKQKSSEDTNDVISVEKECHDSVIDNAKILNPNEDDKSMLTSLAEVASKESPNITVPLSPSNNNTTSSLVKPKLSFIGSPNYSKSPNIAAFLNAYQNDFHDTRSLSGHQLPKFEEIDTIQLNSNKGSPVAMESPNISYLASFTSPKLSPLMNDFPLQIQNIQNQLGTLIPPYEMVSPKPSNGTYTTSSDYVNPTSSNFESMTSTQLVRKKSFTDQSSIGSPLSATSEMSSSLDFIEHHHPIPNKYFVPPPINLYSLHLPDDQLSTLQAFDQHTAAIMSIKNGPSENPWRTFLLPMSANHEVVRSALLAMTCFHIARGDANIRAKGVKFMKDAILSLVNGLSSNKSHRITDFSANSNAIVKKTPPDVALATCIALAMGEAWDRHISTGIAHLRGAKSMVVKVLNKMQGNIVKKQSKKMRRSTSLSDDSKHNLLNISAVDMGKSNTGFSPILEDSLKNEFAATDDEVDHSDNDGNKDLNLNNKVIPKELQFLVNAWMYFDVLARMTSESETEMDLPELEYELESNDSNSTRGKSPDNLENPNGKSISPMSIGLQKKTRSLSHSTISPNSTRSIKRIKSSEPSSGSVITKYRNFNLEEGDTIDPLLGVAQSLFPLMGEAADLIGKVRKYKCMIQKNNPNQKIIKTPLRLISNCVELKTKIEKWEIPNLPNLSTSVYNSNLTLSTDPTFDINATVATAEAYRYSTLLYLHQVIPEVPSPSSHSLAENVMMLLASVPSNSRTLVTHIFPLFVASCEAQHGEEREWVKERWTELVNKMWIGTIDRAWEVVKEVWRRKDIVVTNKMNKYEQSGGNDGTRINDYSNVKRRISFAIHGHDNLLDDDEDNNFLSWSHWTTVMKEWGWEILLA